MKGAAAGLLLAPGRVLPDKGNLSRFASGEYLEAFVNFYGF